jgi:cytochrome c-type biogenesis protein CcmF
VHSFTGEGSTLYWHLILMMLLFIAIPVVFYLKNRKQIPVNNKEESMNSREFWMFVGSLLLMISGVYILVLTSLPFFNKLFGTNWAIGKDVEYVYNRIMVMVAMIIGLLTAIVQYFKYKDTSRKYIWGKLTIPTIIAVVISLLISVFGDVSYDKYGAGFLVAIHMAIWTAVYSVVANAMYFTTVLKGKMKAAGSSIAHFGFGMMMVGILISSSKKELISENRTGIAIPGLKDAKGRDENPLENITLIYNIPTPMGKYVVTYLGDSTEPKNNKVYFKIDFSKTDTVKNKTEHFMVTPNAFMVKSEEGTQLSSNPGSKHYLSSDIFVYITSWLNPDNVKDTANFRNVSIKNGDTVYYSNGFVLVNKVLTANKNDNADLPLVDSAWLSELTVVSKEGQTTQVTPAFFVKDGQPTFKTDTVMQQNLILGLQRAENGSVQLAVKESSAVMRYITLKAYRFPWINLLWLGTVIMVIGFMISMFFRLKSKLYVV